jgi:hypothetical protein
MRYHVSIFTRFAAIAVAFGVIFAITAALGDQHRLSLNPQPEPPGIATPR